MTGSNQKKDGGVSPVLAAMTGAIVGAGVAVAGAIALKNKNTREKVKQVFNGVKDQAVGYVEKMQKEIEGKKSKVEKKLDEGKIKVKKIAKLARETTKKAKKI